MYLFEPEIYIIFIQLQMEREEELFFNQSTSEPRKPQYQSLFSCCCILLLSYWTIQVERRGSKQESSGKDKVQEPMFFLCRRNGRQSKCLVQISIIQEYSYLEVTSEQIAQEQQKSGFARQIACIQTHQNYFCMANNFFLKVTFVEIWAM